MSVHGDNGGTLVGIPAPAKERDKDMSTDGLDYMDSLNGSKEIQQ